MFKLIKNTKIQENQIPLGFAVMIVRGNTSDLLDAITSNNLSHILYCKAN